MDATRSGSISYPDFHNLIFPEDEIMEKAQAAELAMKSHASKKKQFLVKEQKLYEDTFEGEFHGFLKMKDQEQQHIHAYQRMEGAKTQARAEASRIHRIKTGQLNKIESDQRSANRLASHRK